MLLSAGLPLPKEVWAHGYVQWEGAKMSKTAGTAVNLDDAIERHGADPLRYFLLREVGFENDGDFTWDRFDGRYVSDLADGLGNLVARSLSMIAKYRSGIVPAGTATDLDRAGAEQLAKYQAAMDALDVKGGADAAWKLVDDANQYIVKTAPWSLAKQGKDVELDAALHALANCLYRLAVMTYPLIPGKAAEIWDCLGQSRELLDQPSLGLADDPPVAGASVRTPPVLFPKPAPNAPTS
jgi:methionyl-tRNA synthetase